MTRLKNEKGFSLIEVIIALTIMMGTVTILAMAWSTAQLRLRKMRLNHQAAFLLDFKVADIEREYKDQFTLLPDEDAGDFKDLGTQYKDFTWTLSSQKFELPDLTPLIIQAGGAQGRFDSSGGGSFENKIEALASLYICRSYSSCNTRRR